MRHPHQKRTSLLSLEPSVLLHKHRGRESGGPLENAMLLTFAGHMYLACSRYQVTWLRIWVTTFGFLKPISSEPRIFLPTKLVERISDPFGKKKPHFSRVTTTSPPCGTHRSSHFKCWAEWGVEQSQQFAQSPLVPLELLEIGPLRPISLCKLSVMLAQQ